MQVVNERVVNDDLVRSFPADSMLYGILLTVKRNFREGEGAGLGG